MRNCHDISETLPRADHIRNHAVRRRIDRLSRRCYQVQAVVLHRDLVERIYLHPDRSSGTGKGKILHWNGHRRGDHLLRRGFQSLEYHLEILLHT